MIHTSGTVDKVTIIYNEADDYYEVQQGDYTRRFPEKELAVITAHERGGEVDLIAWDDEDAQWARGTLNVLRGMEAQRNRRPYAPKRTTKTHLRWLGVER